MRPHIIRRQQKSVLKGAPHIDLQRLERTVADVATPRDDSESRIGHNIRRRLREIDVGCRQDVSGFVAQIAYCRDKLQRKSLLHRERPGRYVVVLSIAIEIPGRDYTETAVLCKSKKWVQGIRESGKGHAGERIAIDS